MGGEEILLVQALFSPCDEKKRSSMSCTFLQHLPDGLGLYSILKVVLILFTCRHRSYSYSSVHFVETEIFREIERGIHRGRENLGKYAARTCFKVVEESLPRFRAKLHPTLRQRGLVSRRLSWCSWVFHDSPFVVPSPAVKGSRRRGENLFESRKRALPNFHQPPNDCCI